jgi:twinkle protein
MIHDKHKDWLQGRGIDPILAEKLGLSTITDSGGNWLTVPYVERGVTVNHKYRLTKEKRHRMDADAPLVLWNHDVLLRPEVQAGAPVIICEGEWDALVLIQCGFQHVMSVPNGAPATETENPFEARRYEFIQRSRDLIDKVKTFVLATDGDEPGRVLAADLARLLGPERCRFVEWAADAKDANEVLTMHDASTLRANIDNAKPYPVKGLYRLDDFPEPPAIQSLEIGMDGMDDVFRLVPGTFTVITGYAGRGKTSLMMVMLAKLLKRGVPMTLASFETMPRPIIERRMRAALYECPEFDRRALSRGPADGLLADKLGIIAQTPENEDQEMDLDYLLDLAKVAVMRDGSRLLVIDPWNEIEHKRLSAESETDYIGRAIRALKRFARLYECAVWLVAHPRTPRMDGKLKMPTLYDISGSANFANKADYGIVVHREDVRGTRVIFRVIKVRMGLPGRCEELVYDWKQDVSGYERCRDVAA